jgi:hypothetical protein
MDEIQDTIKKSKFHINWKFIIISIIVILAVITLIQFIIKLLSPLMDFIKSVVGAGQAAIEVVTDMLDECKSKENGGKGFFGCGLGIFSIFAFVGLGLLNIGKFMWKNPRDIANTAQQTGSTVPEVTKKAVENARELFPELEKRIDEMKEANKESSKEKRSALETLIREHATANAIENAGRDIIKDFKSPNPETIATELSLSRTESINTSDRRYIETRAREGVSPEEARHEITENTKPHEMHPIR